MTSRLAHPCSRAVPLAILAGALILLDAGSARALDVLSMPDVEPATSAASTSATVSKDEVSVGSVTVSINDVYFHVGDERTIYITTIVSHGNMRANQTGFFHAQIELDGKNYMLAVKEISGNAAGDTRTQYEMSASVQGCEIGTADIEVIIEVSGWENGFFGDDYESDKKTASTTATVNDPVAGPYLNPGSQTFTHAGPVSHSELLLNYSVETLFVDDAWVNRELIRLTSVPPGNDLLNIPMLKVLVTGDVAHEAPSHPGTTEPVPFTWGIRKAMIFVLGGRWTRSYDPFNLSDLCNDPGNPGNGDVDPGETSDESRRESSGQRAVEPRRISRRIIVVWPIGPIIIEDHFGDISYPLPVDGNGHFSWSNLTLGPTVGLELNSAAFPGYRHTVIDSIPLSQLESPSGVVYALTFLETVAGPITGSAGASDGGPLHVEISTRPHHGAPPEPLAMVPAGAFHLSGYAWLDLEGPASELVLVGHPGFNRTLASPETLSIPFPAPVDSVDVGSFVWNILPRSTAPVISFLGRILDRNSGLPIEGVRIETATDPGGMVDGVVWTGPDGRFQLPVSNGPHLVRGYAAGIGYSDSPAESIDFGANGFETFDVGDRYLAPAGASGVPDTGRPDVFLQVSPNPSSGPVTIRLSLPRWGDVRVTVHDVRGRLLFERRGQEPAGALQVNWDGTDREGRPVSSGTYFVRVVGSGFKRTQKVVMTGR